MGGCFGVLGVEPPEANWGLGVKPQAARGWGSEEKAPQPPEALGFGGGAPGLKNFAFFSKNNIFKAISNDKN